MGELRPGEHVLIPGIGGGAALLALDMALAAGAEVTATVPGGLRALRPGGRLVTFGATTGPELALSLRETFFRQVSIRGTSMGSAQEFAAMVDLVAARGIRPVVGSVRPPADGPAVFTESVAATGFGKTVLAVGTRSHEETG